MSEERPFRIGVLCTGSMVPHWQVQCIRRLKGQPGIEVVGIAQVTEHPPARQLRGFMEMRMGGLLFPKTGKREAVEDHVAGSRIRRDGSSKPVAALIETLKAQGADAVLSLLTENSSIPTTTAIPVWHFDVNGQELGTSGLPNFGAWMYREDPVTVDLVSTSGDQARAIFNDRASTGGMNMDAVMLGAAWLPVEMCRTHGRAGQAMRTPMPSTARTTFPTLLMHWLRTELRNTFAGRRKSAIAGEWNIGVFPHPISALLDLDGSTNVRWLNSPSPGSHRSEPFGYRAADGQLNVLYRKGEGVNTSDVIARVRPRNDGILKRSRTMLSTVADLGYPFVLERPDGHYVLISYPHQQRTELFRVAEDNDALDHVRTVLDRAIVNPTCFEHGGRWWLFGTDPEAPDGVLRAYHAPRFDGPYAPHRNDPVKMTGSGCRPAGSCFMHEGALWRPSVNNGDPMALGIHFNRITTLDPEHFAEEVAHTLDGFPGTLYNKGVRTVCAMGDITLVDGIRPAPEAMEMEAADSNTVRKSKEYLEE